MNSKVRWMLVLAVSAGGSAAVSGLFFGFSSAEVGRQTTRARGRMRKSWSRVGFFMG